MSEVSEPSDRRPAVSLYWFFTWNNYDEETLLSFIQQMENDCELFCCQEEVGASGTPHIQGKIKLKERKRPVQHFGIPEIHWEKSKKWKGWTYCIKADTHVGRRWAKGVEIPEEIKVHEPYGWQVEVANLVDQEPDERTINWYWEPDGGVGKSQLVKYLVVKKGAALFGGKAEDAKRAIAEMKKKPRCVIMDIPRCVEHISYTAMEEIKNGCFFSPKYESVTVTMNCPHVIIFANREPELEKLSQDRWNVKRIKTGSED
nr:MAG: replication associated protein [Arizlama virus]